MIASFKICFIEIVKRCVLILLYITIVVINICLLFKIKLIISYKDFVFHFMALIEIIISFNIGEVFLWKDHFVKNV